ncbi:MAG: hypothetical protein WA876_04985 [Candidatus Acidiferrales bacterium]
MRILRFHENEAGSARLWGQELQPTERPADFDEEKALDSAVMVFWEKD